MIIHYERERNGPMNSSRINRNGEQYVVAFRVFVQPDGSMVVVMGNQRLEVTADGVHALLCGTLEYARVFASLHKQVDETLETLSKVNGRVI